MSVLLPPAALSPRKIARSLVARSCLVATAAPTFAAYNPREAARGFTVFVEKNMALGGGHVGADTAAGGSVLMNGTGIFGMDRTGDYTSLAVKGRIVWPGSLTFGSTSHSVPTNSTFNASVSHGTVKLGDTTGTDHWYQLQYKPSWTDTTPRTTAKLSLKANQINFITLDATSCEPLSDVTLTGAARSHGTEPVFNISGSGAVKFGSFNEFGVTASPYILYNFADATSVAMNDRTISGSILAPNAVFTHGNQNVDGQIIAASFIQQEGGETHNVMLDLQVVPEPAAVAAVLGLFVLGFVIWCRRDRRV